jgi:hypothetical protein
MTRPQTFPTERQIAAALTAIGLHVKPGFDKIVIGQNTLTEHRSDALLRETGAKHHQQINVVTVTHLSEPTWEELGL